MRKLVFIFLICASLVACVESAKQNQREALLLARTNIHLPENCLQFDSVGLGMNFADAKIIVQSDSDFWETEYQFQNGDSVIEFKHDFYLYDGGVTGFRGKIHEYNDSVEVVSLTSFDSGYDYPTHLSGTFLKVAMTYKEKYGYEPAPTTYAVNSYTERVEYVWRKGDDKVVVSFEVEKLRPDNGEILYTGKLEVRYVDEILNSKRNNALRERREAEANERKEQGRQNMLNQNI